jgi:hypothetical protein
VTIIYNTTLSENSLREALEYFESFYKVSGLKMNSSKTKAVWVGNKKYSDQIICPNMKLNWSRENFKVSILMKAAPHRL